MTGPTKDQAEDRLSRSVMDALSRSEPLRARDLSSLRAVSRGNTVVLQGLVATEAHKYAAIQLARAVPGVDEVVDELVTDQDLERRVAVALASDEATRRLRVAVRVAGGVATLYGAVPSKDDAEKVQAMTLAVAQISGATNKLHVVAPGMPVVLTWQNSVEGRPLPTPAPSAAPAEEAITESEPEKPKAPPMAAGMEGAA